VRELEAEDDALLVDESEDAVRVNEKATRFLRL